MVGYGYIVAKPSGDHLSPRGVRLAVLVNDGRVAAEENLCSGGVALYSQLGKQLIEYVLSQHSEHNIYADILHDELEHFYKPFGFMRKELGLLLLQRNV